MWWLFLKTEESRRLIRYAYSRESEELDGIIQYDREKNEVLLIKPCRADEGSAFSERKAKEMFRFVVREGFPERRQVACG